MRGAWRRLILAGIAAIACLVPLDSAAAQTCPDTTFIDDYPLGEDGEGRENGWSEEAQGVAHDAGHWYFTEKDRLLSFPVGFDLFTEIDPSSPPAGVQTRSIGDLFGDDFDHIGDLDQHGGFLFVPLEGDHRAVALVRASDLTTLDIETVDQANAGWLAIDRGGDFLYTSGVNAGHDSAGNDFPIYRYPIDTQALDDGDLVLGDREELFLEEPNGDPLQPPLRVTQGGTFSPLGDLYLSNGDADSPPGTIEPPPPFPPGVRGGIHLFGPPEGDRLRMITESTNGSGSFNFEYHPGGDFDRPRRDARGARGNRLVRSRPPTHLPRDQRSASRHPARQRRLLRGRRPGRRRRPDLQALRRRLLLRGRRRLRRRRPHERRGARLSAPIRSIPTATTTGSRTASR